ncbi:MAG: ferritin family protein [Desulfobacteraceae bacterium]|nr:ferritin family protein [Desulfobacteraceae bacterium]
MAYDFSVNEVFEMAIQIEANGANFYRKAAGFQNDPSDKQFLEKLAHMEDKHKATFEAMRQQVSDAEKERTVFDPANELSMYLKAMADSHGGEGNPDIAESFTGKEAIEEIITTAIGLEKESILFYLGLKDLVPPKYGHDKLDHIIKEEKLHIAQLNGFLKKANA